VNEKLEQAKKEGRLLVFDGESSLDYPLLLAIDWEQTKLVHAPEHTPPYQMHMLTRRTHLNPGETMKIALLFEDKIPTMPEAAYFNLALHLTCVGWRFSLKEEENNTMTYNEVTARSQAYIAQLEADRKTERKRRNRITTSV